MKTLNTTFIFLITILFIACSSDEEIIQEPTFTEKYQGDWVMTMSGDIQGTYSFIVAKTPSTYQTTPFSISGDNILSTEFECRMTLSEDASFSIDLDTNVLTQRGLFTGTLDEFGTGEGDYTIVAWDVDEFAELPLRGTFTLEKL